jgi:hypothetical protein
VPGPPPRRKLLRVTAPHLCAGAVFVRDPAGWRCERAAPILKWMVGKPPAEIARYLEAKGWAREWLDVVGE